MRRLLMISMGLFGMLVLLQFTGCVATSNYYTGKTLEKGETAVTGGFDNIVIQDAETHKIEKKDMLFTPTFGVAWGLPLRLELGLRWYLLKTFEGDLRWQLNPRTFQPFDLSFNFHYGIWEFETTYLKYGATLSKRVWKFEPSLSYFEYEYTGTIDFHGELSGLLPSDFHAKSNVLTIGLGYHLPNAILIPEANYQFAPNIHNKGVIYYGIGIRIIS